VKGEDVECSDLPGSGVWCLDPPLQMSNPDDVKFQAIHKKEASIILLVLQIRADRPK